VLLSRRRPNRGTLRYVVSEKKFNATHCVSNSDNGGGTDLIEIPPETPPSRLTRQTASIEAAKRN
jgi:hypothetical protein